MLAGAALLFGHRDWDCLREHLVALETLRSTLRIRLQLIVGLDPLTHTHVCSR